MRVRAKEAGHNQPAARIDVMRTRILLEQRHIVPDGSDAITPHQHRAMLDQLVPLPVRHNRAIADEDV